MDGLEEVIEAHRKDLAGIPEGSPSRISALNNLGVVLQMRYERTGLKSDLQETIEVFKQAAAETPLDHPGRDSILPNLGKNLGRLYERSYDRHDLEEALKVNRQTLEITPDDHPNRLRRVNNLALNLQNRYEWTNSMADLQEIVDVLRHGLAIPSGDPPARTALSLNLCNNLETRHERNGNIADLDEAIEIAREDIDSVPEDHPFHLIRLNNLAIYFNKRYLRNGNEYDLKEGLEAAREAVSVVAEDDPTRGPLLDTLGNTLKNLYDQTQDIDHLEEAIQISRQAMAATSEDDPEYASRLNNLGTMLSTRFERDGEVTDITEALDLAQKAIAYMPNGHPNRVRFMGTFANFLGTQQQQTNSAKELEEAINVTRQAVTSMPEDDPEHAELLHGLGQKLARKYQQTQAMADLEEAISVTRRAVAGRPDGHPDRISWLNDLARYLNYRHSRTGSVTDLDEAISLGREAIEVINPSHPDYVLWLDYLANNIHTRYWQTKAESDFEEALSMSRQIVITIPKKHIQRPVFLGNLAARLQEQFEQNGSLASLDEAIATVQQAIYSLRHNDPELASYSTSLGQKLKMRYDETGNAADLDAAAESFQKAWNVNNANPLDKIKAASECVGSLMIQQNSEAAAEIGKDAIDMLPLVKSQSPSRNDQQHIVATFAGMTANLCAALLAMGQVDDALDYLERGRATIVGQLMDDQADVLNLAQDHPDMAQEYRKLRDGVNIPVEVLKQSMTEEKAVELYRQTVSSLNTCIDKIRQLPGHYRFLRGSTSAEIQECAEGGSIVVVNITIHRSDAIIITPTAVEAVNLSNLKWSDAKSWLQEKWTGPRREIRKRNERYLEYLAWLWTSCVEKILEKLHSLKAAQHDGRFRIWWIGSGFANSMPFHAAGIHQPNSTDTTYHQTIASYTPSIKALAHARKRIDGLGTSKDSLLLVSMPTTPAEEGKKPMRQLDGAAEEKEIILQTTKERLETQVLEYPSIEHVLKELQECSIAHFACHGTTDHRDPSKSGLILQKHERFVSTEGNSSDDQVIPRPDKLTVGSIFAAGPNNARLAYLSACSTAENKSRRLMDEVIHVVSGFLVAGFPHVVGCLWPSNDRSCVMVAKEFYSHLFENENTHWRDEHVADALRQAVMKVREDDMKMPLYWAQFVHYGV